MPNLRICSASSVRAEYCALYWFAFKTEFVIVVISIFIPRIFFRNYGFNVLKNSSKPLICFKSSLHSEMYFVKRASSDSLLIVFSLF